MISLYSSIVIKLFLESRHVGVCMLFVHWCVCVHFSILIPWYKCLSKMDSETKLADVILAQIDTVKDECRELSSEILENEQLVDDMIDYLCDNEEIDLDKHFKPTDFIPGLIVDLPCTCLPSAPFMEACALKLQSYYIRVDKDRTWVVVELRNVSDKYASNIVGALLAENIVVPKCKSCLLMFPETTHQHSKISPRGHSLLPFYTHLVKPKELAYLVLEFDSPEGFKEYTIVLRYYEANSYSSDLIDPFLHSVGTWNQCVGTLDRRIKIDPWSATSLVESTETETISNSGDHRLKMKICSYVAFHIGWTVDIQTTSDFIREENPILNLQVFSENPDHSIVVASCRSLPDNLILSRRVDCKSGDDYNKISVDVTRLILTIFCAESTADKFFRKLSSSKLCSKIEDTADSDLESLTSASSQQHRQLAQKLMNKFVDERLTTISHGDNSDDTEAATPLDVVAYRKLHCRLLCADATRSF